MSVRAARTGLGIGGRSFMMPPDCMTGATFSTGSRRLLVVLALMAGAACTRGEEGGTRPGALPTQAATEHQGVERPGMGYVRAGEFLMGSSPDDALVYPWEASHEQPQHPVYVHGFYIDRTEVTNAEFERFDPTHPRSQQSACDACPVTVVDWASARAYCAAQQSPKRLPTEAEWEKAAKGGRERTPEPFDDYAWYSKNSIKQAQPVAQKKPNDLGLYDMVGNVREWTNDWYDPNYYQERVRDDPLGPAEGTRRVERGGAFFLPRRGVTETIRYNHPPHFKLYFLGFRCAQDE